MASTRKTGTLDTTPHIRPAGKTTVFGADGAKQCVEPDLATTVRPQTPPEIKKYRKSNVHEPGKILTHYGLADDTIPGGVDRPFGCKNSTGEDLKGLIQTFPTSDLMQWRLERQEDIYASSKNEPLGRSMQRGHKLPAEGEPFGTRVNAKLKNKMPETKALLYPVGTEADFEGKHHAQYVKSHGDYAPGEQRRRGYDWDGSGIDPASKVFGYHEKIAYREGVAKALNPTLQDDAVLSATIVQKRLEDFKMTDSTELGQSTNLGHGDRGLPGDHTFGVPSRRFEELGVRHLIKGEYADADQAPDPDLGKSLRKGFRNVAPSAEKVFGAPTIRTDIAAPASKSVADTQNYGNEPDASSLLYPAPAAERGVVEEDYLKPFTKQGLQEFYAMAQINLPEPLFDAAFHKAVELDVAQGGPANQCCISTFHKARFFFANA
mmetsp:Transcript_15215/g.49938  ORF Transcript_15215/g.49938 Transcript_15215/m.49938 type:complete len:434 (+) Transcript_15215:25-1326(+)